MSTVYLLLQSAARPALAAWMESAPVARIIQREEAHILGHAPAAATKGVVISDYLRDELIATESDTQPDVDGMRAKGLPEGQIAFVEALRAAPLAGMQAPPRWHAAAVTGIYDSDIQGRALPRWRRLDLTPAADAWFRHPSHGALASMEDFLADTGRWYSEEERAKRAKALQEVKALLKGQEKRYVKAAESRAWSQLEEEVSLIVRLHKPRFDVLYAGSGIRENYTENHIREGNRLMRRLGCGMPFQTEEVEDPNGEMCNVVVEIDDQQTLSTIGDPWRYSSYNVHLVPR